MSCGCKVSFKVLACLYTGRQDERVVRVVNKVSLCLSVLCVCVCVCMCV